MNLLKQVTFDRASRRKDKTFSFTFTTDLEQNKEDINNIFDNVDNGGVLYFKPSGIITDEEVKAVEVAKIPKEGKSKSQLLRNVLYRVYENKPCSKKGSAIYLDFNAFYANEMNKITQHYKDKLPND
tara:strand:- start:3672 stop:4052 length:381 start_codon:yes stop_codon:yes gene_type:complete